MSNYGKIAGLVLALGSFAAAAPLANPAAGQSQQQNRNTAVQITQPVLNMRGVNTQPYFRECFETVQMWHSHAENFVLPKATHAMLQTNPKGAAERVASFLSGHRLMKS